MSAIIRSSQSDEVALIFPSTKDLRFNGLEAERVQELVVLIQESFNANEQEKTLHIYTVPQYFLTEWAQECKRRNPYENLPDNEYRDISSEQSSSSSPPKARPARSSMSGNMQDF